MKFWNEIVMPALESIVQDILGILPEVAGALTILIIGWIIAKVISRFVGKLLGRVGLDSIADKAGITEFLQKSGIKEGVGWVVSKLIFWALMLMFLLSAAEALSLAALADTLQSLVAYIPNLIVVVLVIVFGALLARVAGRLTQGAAASANIDFAPLLGTLVTNFIMLAVFVIAISQLEIQSRVLDYTFIAILAAFALAIALTLGMGSRDVAQGIIYGVYARKIFTIGRRVRVDDREGQLLSIGTVNSTIQTSEGLISVPNRFLIEGFVTLLPE